MIGVGFNLKRGNARQVFAKALPGVSFDAVYKGQSLTEDQCMKLFAVSSCLLFHYILIPPTIIYLFFVNKLCFWYRQYTGIRGICDFLQ